MSANTSSIAQDNMIEQQIRPWSVLDGQVLDLMHGLPREPFMPEKYKQLAYADIPAPLGGQQTMLEPRVAGRVLQALDIQKTDQVLEIGTGSGYLTACMALMGKQVDSWELQEALLEPAQQALTNSNISNVNLSTGDGFTQKFDKKYDAIVITGAVNETPGSLKQQLSNDGRLLAFVDQNPIVAILINRNGNSFSEEILFEADVSPMVMADASKSFVF